MTEEEALQAHQERVESARTPEDIDQAERDERARREQEAAKPTEDRPEELSTDERIARLEAALAASRTAPPIGVLPEHAAGVGLDVAETWGQHEQMLAREGRHPAQQNR